MVRKLHSAIYQCGSSRTVVKLFFPTLHIYLDYNGERSRLKRTGSINNALTVILRQTTVYELLWLITISNATLHYCKKGYCNSWSVEPQKRKCFNGNVCKVLCCPPHLWWVFWGCTCGHMLYIEEQVPFWVWGAGLNFSNFTLSKVLGGRRCCSFSVFWLNTAFILSAAVVLNWWSLKTHVIFCIMKWKHFFFQQMSNLYQ